MVSNPIYTWIPKYLSDNNNHHYLSYYNKPSQTNDLLLIIDERFRYEVDKNSENAEMLQSIINMTKTQFLKMFYLMIMPIIILLNHLLN